MPRGRRSLGSPSWRNSDPLENRLRLTGGHDVPLADTSLNGDWKPETLAELLRRRSEAHPHAPALHFRDAAVDYATLNERASRLANALRSINVGATDRVAFLGTTSSKYFELLFGAAKINAVPVPINHRLAPSEIGLILADSEASVIFVSKEFEGFLETVRSAAPKLRHVISLDEAGEHLRYDAWLTAHVTTEPPGTASPSDIALQVYTSGTTGRPKGAMISGSALVAHLAALATVARIDRDSVTMSSLPMFHIGGNAWALAGLLRGCQTVLLPETVPAELLARIAHLGVTVMFAVPAVIQRLLDAPEMLGTDCRSLKTLYYGGSPITDALLKRALTALECDLVQGFGMSECGLITALAPEDHDVEKRPDLLRSCGRALPQTEVRLVDTRTLQDVPVGAVGELWVRSPLVMSGYFNNRAETAAALTPDGWLRTGDAARMDEAGYFFLADRIKDMIISGGENVYSAEVENVLMDHDAVKECAVIGVPSPRWGETVKAIVVRAPSSGIDEAGIIAFCRERLAHYKCPTSVAFVDELPRNPSGKVLKHLLRQRH
jgi:long-chain acyl-CoA synthetase